MATNPPTVAQMLTRFKRWMKQNFPGFPYTQTNAERLLRDYRMGRATLPRDLRFALAGTTPPAKKVLPAKLPTKRPVAKKVLPAKLPTKKAPRPTPKKSPPIVIRPEPHPPARPSSRIQIAEDEYDDDWERVAGDETLTEEEMEDFVEIRPMGVVEWLEDWGDYGNLDVDIVESDS